MAGSMPEQVEQPGARAARRTGRPSAARQMTHVRLFAMHGFFGSGEDPPYAREELSAALEAALIRELQSAFDWENWARFRNRLKQPVIALSDAADRLGRWVRATRMLELSRPLVCERPWPEVIGVLQHEMAHQF